MFRHLVVRLRDNDIKAHVLRFKKERESERVRQRERERERESHRELDREQ